MLTELYTIDGPWPGKLAIMPRPRGGDWLEDEVQAWRTAGVDTVVSLLTPEEIDELELQQEAKLCKKVGTKFVSFPIEDREIPTSMAVVANLVQQLEAELNAGKRVAIHCRAGIGRSSMIAACLLASAGEDVEVAFTQIRNARGRPVPDTEQQKAWVGKFAKTHLTSTK